MWLLLNTIIGGIVGLVVAWVIPTLLLTAMLAAVLRRRWDFVEWSSVATALALVLIPNLLRLEQHWTSQPHPWFSVLNTFGIVVGAFLFNFWRPIRPYVPPLPSFNWRQWLHQPWLWVVILLSVLTVSLMLMYSSLPDIDPYKWLKGYRAFTVGKTVAGVSGRPAFYELVYLLQTASQIEPYYFFKYFFPWLALLYIPSAWLIARRLTSKVAQVVWLLIPLASASTWLYFQLMIPQAPLILFAYQFVCWLLYARLTNDQWWYYAAGSLVLFGSSYHQGSLLLLLPWLIVTLITDISTMWRWAQRNPLAALLAILLVTSHPRLFIPLQNFFSTWFLKILVYLHLNFNWAFPAHYTNIDHQSVGWPGMGGVLKYYLFYAGAPVFIISVALLARVSQWRSVQFWANRSAVVLGLLLVGFLSITEILPRVFQLALLPERAWIFLGLVLFGLALPLLSQSRWLNYLLLSGIVISIGGALYVNYLKQFYIPNYQYDSAVWLRHQLSPHSFVLSSGHSYVLEGVANTTVIGLPNNFYCTNDLANDETLRDLLQPVTPQLLDKQRSATIDQYLGALHTYFVTTQPVELTTIDQLTTAYVPAINRPVIPQPKLDLRKVRQQTFVYFAQEDPRNPIASRPYAQEHQETIFCPQPQLDRYPETFQKVYDDHGKVMIWRLR